MSTGLVDIIKLAAMEVNENSKPCDLRYGTVATVDPLSIRITNQFVLPESILIVPEHLTDYEIETTIMTEYNWNTQNASGGSGESAYASHNHDIYHDKKKIKIHGKLKVGDKVVLLRQSGGQFYYVADRLPKE